MSTDRELLELAAKAAGKDSRLLPFDINDWKWNPLTDDGDALRLAVKLRIHIRHFPHDVEAQIERGYWQEHNNQDPYAATRRAIVRAASEIGKSK